MGCIEETDYEILLPSASIKECVEYIKNNFKEVYYVPKGHRIFNTCLIGNDSIPVAVDGDYVVLPYVKPCRGSFVLRIKSKEEGKRLRSSF